MTSVFFGWAAVMDYYDYMYVVSPWLDEQLDIPLERRGLRPSKELDLY